jgi:hypothetical protein
MKSKHYRAVSARSLEACRIFPYKNPYGFPYKWDWVVDRTNRHLKEKLGYWHYQRRVPKRYAPFDPRGVIECSLRTKSLARISQT